MRRIKTKKFNKWLLLLLIIAAGCSNNIVIRENPCYKFLKDKRYRFIVDARLFLQKQPKIVTGHYENSYAEMLLIMHKGYYVFGSAEFSCTKLSDEEIIDFGTELNADILYIAKEYYGFRYRESFQGLNSIIQDEYWNYTILLFWDKEKGIDLLPYYKKHEVNVEEEIKKLLEGGNIVTSI